MTFFFSLPNAREECLIFFFLLYYLLQLVNSIPSVEKREKKTLCWHAHSFHVSSCHCILEAVSFLFCDSGVDSKAHLSAPTG